MREMAYIGAEPGTDFVATVCNAGMKIRCVPTLEQAQELLRVAPPIITVLDLGIGQAQLREAIISLLLINARVHSAVVTDMPTEIFHNAMEGLGILCALPPDPGEKDAATLLTLLAQVDGMAVG